MARILYVVHQYLPYFPTGVERATHNTAQHFQKLGYEVSVLSAIPQSRQPEFEPESYVYEGVEVVQYRVHEIREATPPHRWHQQSAGLVAFAIDRFQPDIVHVQHPMMYPEAREVAASYGLRTVVHLHDYWYLCPRIQRLRPDATVCYDSDSGADCETVCGIEAGRERLAWAKNELACYDAVFVPTWYVASTFEAEGFDVSDWIVLPAGVPPNLLAAIKKPGVISCDMPLRIRYLGALLRHKGIDVLLEAVSKIPDAPLRVFVHGDAYHENDYFEFLRERARTDKRISFEGPYDFSELPELLSCTDVVVIPSIWPETQSLVAEFAIASGVPVVCTGPSGMSEVVDDASGGWIAPLADSHALASVLEEIVSKPEILVEKASNIRPMLRLETEAAAIDAAYKALLSL